MTDLSSLAIVSYFLENPSCPETPVLNLYVSYYTTYIIVLGMQLLAEMHAFVASLAYGLSIETI